MLCATPARWVVCANGKAPNGQPATGCVVNAMRCDAMRRRTQLIEALTPEGIEFVVAPFEADAQLACAPPPLQTKRSPFLVSPPPPPPWGLWLRGHCSFMAAERTIDAVITEDGDLVRTNQANARFSGGGGGGGRARNA